MIAKITPSCLSGTVIAPPSKSMAHRYIICAALAHGTSRIDNIAYSEDIKATLDCIEALGAKVQRGENYVIISGADMREAKPESSLCARESGSTLRFLVPLALLSGSETHFTGSERLLARPLGVYEKIALDYGFKFEKSENGLFVKGKLEAGIYNINENKSSQFISGLLFALPLLSKDSEIVLSDYPESKPYIDMTIDAMKTYGVNAPFDGERKFKILGNQNYIAQNTTVEGDCSNGAFFEALTVLGHNVSLTGIREDTLQGDYIYKKYFEIIKNEKNPTLDISDCPDLAPILLSLLAQCGGGKLTGTKRLKYKESDRGEVMRCELAKFGAKIHCYENEIVVENTPLHTPSEPIMSNSDHRVVMSAAVLMTKHGGEISGCEAVTKSMPDFFGRLSELGAKIQIKE